MKTKHWLAILSVASVVGTAAVWLPPNVILITVDAQRPDRLSACGYTKHQTPNIDRLDREGALLRMHSVIDLDYWLLAAGSSCFPEHWLRAVAFSECDPDVSSVLTRRALQIAAGN